MQWNKTRRYYLNTTEYSSTHTKYLNLCGIATFIMVLSLQDDIACFTRKKPFWFAAWSQVSIFKVSIKLGSNIQTDFKYTVSAQSLWNLGLYLDA